MSTRRPLDVRLARALDDAVELASSLRLKSDPGHPMRTYLLQLRLRLAEERNELIRRVEEANGAKFDWRRP